MKTRSTIVWLMILLLLGGLSYYYEVVVEKERKETEANAKLVFQFDLNQIRELKLARSNKKTITCIKGEGDAWNLTEPVQAIADESVVTHVLNGLAAAEIERVLAERIDDARKYGFDKAEYDIEFKSKDKTYRLILGKKNPTDYFYYARYGDREKLFLVPYSISYNINKDLFEFRDKTVLSVNSKETSALDIDNAGEIIKVVKQEGNVWKVIQPKSVDAGKNEVNKYITSISLLRARKFLTKDESTPQITGLDSHTLTIRLTVGKDMANKSLLIGKKEEQTNQYFARRGEDEEVFMLDKMDVDRLKFSADDFRPKQIFSFDKEGVQTIELKHSGIVIVLKKVQDGWKLEKPEAGPAKGIFVSELLSDVYDLQVEKFLDGPAQAEYGYNEPVLEVVLRLKGDKVLTMSVGKKTGENFYVQAGSQNYLVNSSDIEQLKRDPGEFRKTDTK